MYSSALDTALALAHHVDRLVEAGDLPDYAAAARALGVTRARLSQLQALLLLAPEIQERVLVGELGESERGLRRMDFHFEEGGARVLLNAGLRLPPMAPGARAPEGSA